MSALTNNRLTQFFARSGEAERFAWAAWARRAAIAVVCLAVAHLIYAFFAFSLFYGRDAHYPDAVFARFETETPHGGAGSPVGRDSGAPGAGGEGGSAGGPDKGGSVGMVEADESPERCERPRAVAIQQALIRQVVQENLWAPARPLYKLGFFGVVDFQDTPFFDNKASEQIGILDITRRMAIELTDSLGRLRGTSLQNEELANAQAALRVNERAWHVNSPFNDSINTISPSAASSYARAIRLYGAYNDELANCEDLFDTRSDNLRELLNRFTATLGSTTTELARRSRAYVYDPEVDRFTEASGNNAGWFDFEADNYFHRARGKMYALHGLLQGVRADFNTVLTERNIQEVWDKMEVAVAEAAVMDPLIVSNGAADSAITPDHLGKMAEVILRARASMVELRDILRN